MVHIHAEIVINRPLEEVFDVVADTSREPPYNPRMHHAETASTGRPVDMVIEITDYHRPHSLSSTTHMSSMNLHGTLTFEPVPEGTRMEWSWDLEPCGVLRLLSPLIATIGRRQEQSISTGLKPHLESTPELRSSLGPALSVHRNRTGGLVSGRVKAWIEIVSGDRGARIWEKPAEPEACLVIGHSRGHLRITWVS